MTAQIYSVDDRNFDEVVVRSADPVLVDFWAPWCAPCMSMLPILQAIAVHYEDILRVVKINVDECPDLADRLGVGGIPYIVLMRRGEIVAQLRERTRTRLSQQLDALLLPAAGA